MEIYVTLEYDSGNETEILYVGNDKEKALKKMRENKRDRIVQVWLGGFKVDTMTE